MIRRFLHILLALAGSFTLATGQESQLDFDGQISLFGSYLPQTHWAVASGVRYIPQLDFNHAIDSTHKLDGELSLNLYGTGSIHPWNETVWDANLSPYRIWLRYAGPRMEWRVGLQKIDFGSATALRPLQWFNQIDPRDPLQITNGVYGVLGRYYFLNNANIWVWGLGFNRERRGLDLLEANPHQPEMGGRFQFPVPKGEMALSWHHRNSNLESLTDPSAMYSPEDRFGFDAKWDVGIGLWLEASFAHVYEPIDQLTNQLFATVGADYTFGLGHGLNVIAEHLVYSFDESAFSFVRPGHFTAAILSYPVTLNDQLISIQYYNWEAAKFSYFLNYQHQFPRITGYLMAFYIPPGQVTFQQSGWITPFTGPGLRIMLVYNH